MNKFRAMSYVGILLILVSCAPIDGIGGDEDNLPEISEETTEKSEPISPKEAEDEATDGGGAEALDIIAPTESEEVNYVKITADALNVRSDANIEAKRLTKIYEGQIYQVLDQKKDALDHLWYKVEAPEAIIGWVSSDFCLGAKTHEELVVEE